MQFFSETLLDGNTPTLSSFVFVYVFAVCPLPPPGTVTRLCASWTWNQWLQCVPGPSLSTALPSYLRGPARGRVTEEEEDPGRKQEQTLRIFSPFFDI